MKRLAIIIVALLPVLAMAEEKVAMGYKIIPDDEINLNVEYLATWPNETLYSNEVEAIDPPVLVEEFWNVDELGPLPETYGVSNGYVVAETNQVEYINPNENIRKKYRRIYMEKFGDPAMKKAMEEYFLKKAVSEAKKKWEDDNPDIGWPYSED